MLGCEGARCRCGDERGGGELGGRREEGKGSKQWENEMMKPASGQA
jgi:hypothetical protein